MSVLRAIELIGGKLAMANHVAQLYAMPLPLQTEQSCIVKVALVSNWQGRE